MKRQRFTPRILLLTAALIGVVIIGVFVFVTSQHPTNTPQTHVVVFNFDDASPSLSNFQNTPFTQTKDNLTATFSSPSDPDAFSVNSDETDGLKLSKFSGKYLADNKNSRDILDIKFSEQILDVKLTFTTIEHQSETIQVPSDILITVYNNTKLVGSNRAYGSFSADSYPQGTLTFFAGMQFNWIRISMPSQNSDTTDFMIDNITVSLVSKP